MQWHDMMEPLSRWFRAHARDRYALEPDRHEWLVVEEETRHNARGRAITYWRGTIGSDGPEPPREVLFEHGAPAPPTFYRKPIQPYGEYLRERREREERWKAYEERRRLEIALRPPAPKDATPVESTVALDESVTKEARLRRNV